jgi:hypothetical protein
VRLVLDIWSRYRDVYVQLKIFKVMARQAGPPYLIGKIGNLIYYKMGGEHFVKENGAPTRAQIKKGKNYKKTRESNVEFAGGSLVSKTFREAFSSLIESYVNQSLCGKLTGIFRKMISKGSGKEGMRKLEMSAHKDDLIGFEFHKDYLFKKIFRASMKLEMKKGRKEIALTIPKFKTTGSVSKPKGASHFRIVLGVGIISDHVYSKSKKRYVPSNALLNGKSNTVYSDYVDVSKTTEEFQMHVKFKSAIPDDCSLVVLMGIQFFKEERIGMYGLETKRALMIKEVF